MHEAGTKLAAARERARDLLQESVTTPWVEWAGGRHNSLKLIVGETNRRHGAGLHCMI
jgi:hypothetical protein